MKVLKYASIAFATLFVVAAVGLFVFVHFYLSPAAKDLFAKRASDAFGAPVAIESVSLGFLPPLKATLKNVKFTWPDQRLVGSVDRIEIVSDLGLKDLISNGSLGRLSFVLHRPVLVWSPFNPAPAVNRTNVPLLPEAIALDLRTHDGSFRLAFEDKERVVVLDETSFQISSANTRFENFQFSVSSRARIGRGEITISSPLSLASPVIRRGERWELKDIKGDLAGVLFSASGYQDFGAHAGDWRLKSTIPELSKLPSPPTFLPQGKWKGGFAIDLHHSTQPDSWLTEGVLKTNRLEGDTEFKVDDLSVKGILTSDADLDFKLTPSGDGNVQIKAPRLNLKTDLSRLEIEKKNVFKKPAGIPLALEIRALGSRESIRMDKADLTFAGLRLAIEGLIGWESGSSTSLAVRIEKTFLSGWEKYFPMLSGAPVRGTIELAANVKGDLAEPEKMTVEIKPLLLDGVAGDLRFTSPDGKTMFSGPFAIDGKMQLEASGPTLLSAMANIQVDLSEAAIDLKDQFAKKSGVSLTFGFDGKQSGNQIQIQTASLQMNSSRLLASGKIANPQRPSLNLNFQIPKVNLGELAMLFPFLDRHGVSGVGEGNLSLTGSYDFKEGLDKSPLALKGQVSVQVTNLKLAQSSPDNASAVSTEPRATLLPEWPLFANADLLLNFIIGRVQIARVSGEGLVGNLSLKDAELFGHAKVENFLGGSAEIRSFRLKPLVSAPDAEVDIDFHTIDSRALTDLTSKDWSELIQGRLSGTGKFVVPFFEREDFARSFKGTGRLQIKNGSLSALELDRLVKEKLSTLPGIGEDKTVATDTEGTEPSQDASSLATDIVCEFKLENEKISLEKLQFKTRERNELRLDGSIGFDKNMDLIGMAYLTDAPVTAKVRKVNSDAAGRFSVPLRIKGALSNPEAEFSEETLARLQSTN